MIRIEAPHFVAGCAPIISYMTGWGVSRILAYCLKKHWRAQILA